MSEITLRDLAAACAPKLAPKITERLQKVLVDTVREELPSVLEHVLAEMIPGETFKHYAAIRPASRRRLRDDAIRAKYNGRNCAALAKEFGLSPRMVFKIVAGRK